MDKTLTVEEAEEKPRIHRDIQGFSLLHWMLDRNINVSMNVCMSPFHSIVVAIAAPISPNIFHAIWHLNSKL